MRKIEKELLKKLAVCVSKLTILAGPRLMTAHDKPRLHLQTRVPAPLDE